MAHITLKFIRWSTYMLHEYLLFVLREKKINNYNNLNKVKRS